MGDSTPSVNQKAKSHISHDEATITNQLNQLEYGLRPQVSGDWTPGALWSCRKGFAWCLLSTAGVASIEYHNTVSANVVSNSSFIARVGESGLGAGGTHALDPKHLQMWAGVYAAGFLLASASAWLPLDRFGRRMVLQSAQLLIAASMIIQILAGHWAVWMIARLLAGLAAGLDQCASIVYLSEAAPAGLRGAALASFQLASVFGQTGACIAEQLLMITAPSGYRRLLLSQVVFVSVGLAVSYGIPESPRWLVLRGRLELAEKSLWRLHQGMPGLEVGLSDIIDEAGRSLEEETSHKLLQRHNVRRMFISGFPLAWQSWFGAPILLRYTLYFFQLAGVIDPFESGLATRALLLAGAMAAICLVDLVGRRKIFLLVTPVMPMAVFVIAGLVHHSLQSWTGDILTLSACLWIFAYGTSSAPLAWVYLGETAHVRLRPKSISLATTLAGLIALLGQYCTPVMIANRSFGLFITACFYGCTGLIGIVLFFFLVPETKGLSYKQLDAMYSRGLPARSFNARSQDM